MDVDLLRPGTAPISPDTVLWFEFLLDPNLLQIHLSKPNSDPTPTDLIIKFTSVVPEPQGDAVRQIDVENPDSPVITIEPEKYTKKHLALKILTLKIAAHLKWNLNILEMKLPPQTQAQIMQDLLYMATDGLVSIPGQEIPVEVHLHKSEVRFALILYHRWILRFLVNRALQAKPSKSSFLHIPSMALDTGYSQLNPNFDKLVHRAESTRLLSIQYLSEITDQRPKPNKLIKLPILDTFVALDENSSVIEHNWDAGDVYVLESEMHMQINYDMCSNFFFYGQYDQAKHRILVCKENMDQLRAETKYLKQDREIDWKNLSYASVRYDEILGYIRALNLAQALLGEKKSLLHQLQESVSNHYTGIIGVLQNDNIKREIPLVHRKIVELDIQGSSSSGIFTVARDLLNRVSALNAARMVLEGEWPLTYPDFNNRLKTVGGKYVEMLYWAFAPVLASKSLSDEDRTKVKNFFHSLAISEHKFPIDQIEDCLVKYDANVPKEPLFTSGELSLVIEDVNSDDENKMDFPAELLSNDWDLEEYSTKSISELEVGRLKQKLIDATTADETKVALVNLARSNPSLALWRVNPQWHLPIPLRSVVMSLQRGFLKDFTYILLGKARQHAENGDYKAALELLIILETEMKNQMNQWSGNNSSNFYKLCKLVGWEILLVQVSQMLSEWPNHKLNISTLVSKCKMCMISLQSGDSVIPRLQILEACLICLLNVGEWEHMCSSPGGSGGVAGATGIHGELAVSVAAACLDLQRHKSKKVQRELWDMILPMFSNGSTSSMKRNNAGNHVYSSSRDSPQTQTKIKENTVMFFSKLRDPIAVTVICSVLARLFNILKDDSHLDLYVEYINMWPTIVVNSNAFNIKSVSETLNTLIVQGLKYYPNNVAWIRLQADLNLANGHYMAAMKNYLCLLTILSDYFSQPLSKQLVEDQSIFRRMIKCCTQINCHTQAAILCQFLDETDYVLAFKCLSEKSHLCSDAMDSYYGCIWDTTMLEFLINLHHRRGETHRKQLAVKVMGMLELNSNNNEEIQREAANSRKAKFMRALVRQYVC